MITTMIGERKFYLLKTSACKPPSQVFKALCSLEVIREDKVVGECDQNPDEVGAKEEDLAGQLDGAATSDS